MALQLIQIAHTVAVVINEFHDRGEAALYRFENGVIRFKQRLLRHIGDANTLLDMHVAVIGVLHARQNFEKGGFARAVAANQANALRSFQGKVSVIKQCYVAESQRCVN